MAKSQKLEESLSALNALADQPPNDSVLAAIRAALAQNRSNALIEKAAAIAAKIGAEAAIPDLVAAFLRLLPAGAKADKACIAKTAIIQALNLLEHDEPEPYLQAVAYRQMEPAYGGPVDTADTVRAECALGLARMGHPDVFFHLVPLLADPEIAPRRAAVAALRALPCEKSELLLRMKILTGDADLCVIGDAVHALMDVAPQSSAGFVGQLLASKDRALVEEAALALGQSRKKAAYDLLIRHWEESIDPEFKKLLLLPIGLMQTEDALEFLLQVLSEGASCYSEPAGKAIGICAAGNAARKQRVREFAAENPDIRILLELD